MSTGLTVETDTRDPDEARMEMMPTYCYHTLTLSDSPSTFRARHAKGGMREFGVYYLSYGPGTTLLDSVPFEDFVLVSRPVSGCFAVRAKTGERLLSPGEPVVLDAHAAYHMSWQRSCTLLTLRVARAEFESAAAEISESGESVPMHFPLHQRPPKARLMALDQVTRFLLRDALPSGLLLSAPLVRGQLIRMLVAGVLEAYAAVADAGEARSAGDVGPAAVRRAIAYIEESAAEDIRISDIAAAARLSPRALQEAFRKNLDTTPMRRLRSVRLTRACADLKEAAFEEGVTVATIAHRWGFGNLGRFSAEFRSEFGQSPSEMLRTLRYRAT